MRRAKTWPTRRFDRRVLLFAFSVWGTAAIVTSATDALADPPTPGAPAEQATKRSVKPPKLTTFVEARAPEGSEIPADGVTVLLRLAIAADGHVSSARVEGAAHPGFDEPAVAAAHRFVFEPAEVDGRPTAVTILYRYRFVARIEKVAAPSELSGVVRTQRQKTALEGVIVQVFPAAKDVADQAEPRGEATSDKPHRAVTDALGRFRIGDLSAGTYRVHIERPDGGSIDTEETLLAGQRLDVVYALSEPEAAVAKGADDDEDEVTVVAKPLARAVTATEIRAEEGRKVPGAQGDVVRVVESLPGVARVSAGSSSIVVWGASPQDTRVYVDSVPLPAVYHLGGLRTVIAPDFVEGVELVPGGQGAAWGRAIGGLVQVNTRPLSSERTRGAIAIDAIDTSAFVEAKVAKDLRAAIAGRRGHLADLVPAFTERDVGVLVPVPRFFDLHGRLGWNPRPNEHLELNVFGFRDTLERTVGSSDPAFVRADGRRVEAGRVWVRYRRTARDGSALTLTPFVGLDGSQVEDRFGAVASTLDRRAELYGVRAAWNGRVADWLTVNAGLDAQVDVVRMRRNGSLTLPAREGDERVFAQPPAEQVNADTYGVATAAAATYLELDGSFFGDRLHIVPGARLEPYVVSVDQRAPREGDVPATGAFVESIEFEPRLAVRFAATKRLSFHGAAGRYRQPPLAEDLSAVFGNPLLPAPTATHFVAGMAAQWTETLGLDLTGFMTQSDGLAMRNPLSSPPIGQALVPTGSGRSFGTQFLLRQRLWHGLSGWLAWTMLRSERKDNDESPTRLSDYDQTHVVSLVLAQSLGAGFDLGIRLRYATGYPRTPVSGAWADLLRGSYQPRFGPTNSTRLPDFVQLDVRASKRTKIGPTELDVWLEVLNVTNRENVEEYVYDSRFQQRSGLRGLPLLPSIGARWSW